MSQSKESPAGSALVAEIDAAWDVLDAMKDDASPLVKPRFDVLQRCFMRARDRISELESSGDAAEIGTLLALKSQFAAQQERIAADHDCIIGLGVRDGENIARIAALEAELAQLRTPVGDEDIAELSGWLRKESESIEPMSSPLDRSRMRRAVTLLFNLARERDEARSLHQELMFQVHRKWPGETRHETAKRYIREVESQEAAGPSAATEEGEQSGESWNRRAQAQESPAAITEIAAERRRQIEVEGWTAQHDDDHRFGELADAAACYAIHAGGNAHLFKQHWPWDLKWWKPTNPRRDLIKAAALIVAEIERLDREKP